MECPASKAAGMYFPLPAPESRPREFGGRDVKNLVINGHGLVRQSLSFRVGDVGI